MRKGAKRKARPAATEAKPKPKATATRAKRVKASQPQPEPEYVEEQRNLQDLWKVAFPVGTEWDRLDSLYQYDWDFSNLEKEFEEEGGKFHGIGNNKVYLFSQTETSSPSVPVLIPTLVAVVAPLPPSMEIGIRSVQREDKEIVPMRQMKMDWIPYIPLEQREGWNSERGGKIKSGSNLPQIFVLGCTQRKASLKQMKEDRWMKFQYCMPYLMNPNEEEKEQSTVVDILFPREPQAPLFVQFDWEFDEVEEYTDELIKAEELTEDKKEAFMAFVKEEVKKVKKKIREEKEAKKADQGLSARRKHPGVVTGFLRLGCFGGFEGVGEAEGGELGGGGFGGEGFGEGEEVDGWVWVWGFTNGLKEAIGGKMRALVCEALVFDEDWKWSQEMGGDQSVLGLWLGLSRNL